MADRGAGGRAWRCKNDRELGVRRARSGAGLGGETSQSDASTLAHDGKTSRCRGTPLVGRRGDELVIKPSRALEHAAGATDSRSSRAGRTLLTSVPPRSSRPSTDRTPRLRSTESGFSRALAVSEGFGVGEGAVGFGARCGQPSTDDHRARLTFGPAAGTAAAARPGAVSAPPCSVSPTDEASATRSRRGGGDPGPEPTTCREAGPTMVDRKQKDWTPALSRSHAQLQAN